MATEHLAIALAEVDKCTRETPVTAFETVLCRLIARKVVRALETADAFRQREIPLPLAGSSPWQ